VSSIGNSDLVRFGEKLRILRNRRGFTLAQLAERLGYKAHGHLSEIESGKKIPTIGLALKVARLFDISTDVLLKDEFEISD
jgi:transcriptional regulator with XRE-family HTH domain